MNRDELIQLSDEGKIKYKNKFLKEVDDETIEKISKEYEAKQLDVTNEQLADMFVGKFSDLLEQTEMVDKVCDLKKKLSENNLFKNDLKNFVGSVTPYIPYIGLISGLLTVGGYIIYKRSKTPKEPQDAEPPEERKPRAPRKPRKPKEREAVTAQPPNEEREREAATTQQPNEEREREAATTQQPEE